MIDWQIKADTFGSCNCDHWCPCQFEGDPTHNACEAFDTFRVLEGHFGDVDLAGVVAANFYKWPGPVYEGGGVMQTVVDVNATPEQVDAIVRLLHGEETREASNAWWIFHAIKSFLVVMFMINTCWCLIQVRSEHCLWQTTLVMRLKFSICWGSHVHAN